MTEGFNTQRDEKTDSRHNLTWHMMDINRQKREKQMQQMVDRINEQDADLVLMLSRPSLSGRETDRRSGYPTEGLGVIDIAKHRNGPTGEIYFRHDKSMTKLVDYEPDLEWMKKNTTR